MREMLRGIGLGSGSFLAAVGALASGIAMLSCGGGGEQQGIVSPTSVATANAPGTVTALARQAQQEDVCHYDKTLGTYSTLSLTPQGVAAHLANHPDDKPGACVVPCPCFGAGDYLAAVEFCQSTVGSANFFCAADPDFFGGVIFNQVACPANLNPTFVYRQSLDTLGNTCSREETGTTTVTFPVSPDQKATCQKIILDYSANVTLC
jgi:hypothetical protein